MVSLAAVHLSRPALVFFALALLLLPPRVTEAAPSERRAEISLGYADVQLVDEATTRLPYHAPSGHLRLRYLAERSRLRWSVALQSGVGPLRARGFPDRAITFGTVDPHGEVEEVTVPMRGLLATPGLELGLQGKRWLGPGPRGPLLFAGGAIGWDVTYPTGFATPGLMQALAFQPTVGLRLEPVPAHRLELSAATTLGAFTTRMPYHQSVSLPDHGRAAGLFAQGSRWQSLGTLQRVDVELRYEHRLTRRLGVEARYALRFLHQALPRDLRSLQHVAALGLHVWF